MIGWRQDIEPAYGAYPEPDVEVIALVVAQDFPDPTALERAVRAGIVQYPGAIWLMRGKPNKRHVGRYAVQVLEEAGIEVIYAETNRPYWGTAADGWRDAELVRTASQVVVFHDGTSPTTGAFVKRKEELPSLYEHLHLVVRGKPKPKKRTGRKPVGV